ncbi:periodic tryptophan protein 2 homolog isoform X2 [Thunnus albacares]|uniref:periodic tryptophan protein 2 homolog isoform X2 n=1 Tax=Thunnus albacares TaxID=8236 RepID=UPI001CF6BF73|nr:periodic tryptophan protein 2 homolog isoform X2 [Thunnus albacares]
MVHFFNKERDFNNLTAAAYHKPTSWSQVLSLESSTCMNFQSSTLFTPRVRVVCGSLPDIYVEKLLGFVAACLEKSGHLQFYMTWAQSLLMLHGQKLKNRCDFNMYNIRYAVALSKQRGMKRAAEEDEGVEEEDEEELSEEMSEASVEDAEMML